MPKRALEVFNQIIGRLESHRQPHEPIDESRCGAILGRLPWV
jgi:hypothetical protein